jgi:hypothetical protein
MEKARKKSFTVAKKETGEPFILEEPQILAIRDSKLTDEERAIRKSLQRIPINARRKAYKKNSAVTIIRNGMILRVRSNRKVKSIGVVKKNQIPIDISKPVKIK